MILTMLPKKGKTMEIVKKKFSGCQSCWST